MPDNTPYRYAVYFAPLPDSPWWQAGSQWLGRCAAGAAVGALPAVPAISEQSFLQATSHPRRYGWHATLKAPFALAPGVSGNDLRSAIQAIADSTPAFDMPPLCVALLDTFLAVVPAPDSAAANAVAARCVTELHALAAPLPVSELQRRRQAQLSPAQDAMLVRWGYPQVLDEYRLHFSLTGSVAALDAEQIQQLEQVAQAWFAPLPTCRFESLALFVEPTPGADFVLQEHFRLRA